MVIFFGNRNVYIHYPKFIADKFEFNFESSMFGLTITVVKLF